MLPPSRSAEREVRSVSRSREDAPVILRVTFRDGTSTLVWCPWLTKADDADLFFESNPQFLRVGPENGPGASWIALDDVRRVTAVSYSSVKPDDVDYDTGVTAV